MSNHKILEIKGRINSSPVVTVFGSSVKGDELFESPSYQTDLEWLKFTKTLASNNVPIINGGYQGTMKLVAEKMNLDNGKCYGVISSSFSDEVEQGLFSDLFVVESAMERLRTLLHVGDMYIFLPGGIGSVVEIVCSLWYIDRGFMQNKPLYFLGSYWENLLNALTERPLMFKNKITSSNIKQFNKCQDFIEDLEKTVEKYIDKDISSYG